MEHNEDKRTELNPENLESAVGGDEIELGAELKQNICMVCRNKVNPEKMHEWRNFWLCDECWNSLANKSRSIPPYNP
jgi:hypothetical protein